jgi:hypothetical protein
MMPLRFMPAAHDGDGRFEFGDGLVNTAIAHLKTLSRLAVVDRFMRGLQSSGQKS